MKFNLNGNATLIVYEYFKASVIMSYSRSLVVSNVAELELVQIAQELSLARLRCTKSSSAQREKA